MTFTVTPVGTGRATIQVTDTVAGAADVSVGVGVSPLHKARRTPQPPSTNPPRVRPTPTPRPNPLPTLSRLKLSATNLTFAGPGQTQTLSALEFGYLGPISAVVVGASVVVLDHTNGPGPAQTFILSSRSAGTAVVRISDDHGNAALVLVTVMPPTPATQPPIRPPTPIPHCRSMPCPPRAQTHATGRNLALDVLIWVGEAAVGLYSLTL